jgi:hypothetical protein
VAVDLYLLQAVLAECFQANAFQERLQTYFYDASKYRRFGKIDWAKYFDFFGEQFLDITHQLVISSARAHRTHD